MSKSTSISNPVSFNILPLLGIAFVILKLCGVIDWSWWWVTAPFWAGLAIVLAVLFGGAATIGVVMLAAYVSSRLFPKRRVK
jgi:phosphoglycerol transferase MdoB-like AlkP superfamily enzyme